MGMTAVLFNGTEPFEQIVNILAPWLTFSGSNSPYLEQISIILKKFEPFKFTLICKL